MNENSMSFTIYLIHELANEKNVAPSEIYRELKKSGCIDNYLVPNYDVLHTMGTQYLVNDIRNYVASRGGAV